jgi:pimeloyl-ACP methyl ester carboxylesterase
VTPEPAPGEAVVGGSAPHGPVPAEPSRREPVANDVIVDGKRLETVRWDGDPSRPAIVMLHEGLGSVSLWRDVPQRLHERTGCTVVAYSRYGYGRSDVLREKREPDYMHHEGEVVLPALLAELGIERPVLFGHSDGASIALIFAGAYPDSVRALVLEAPHVFVEDISVRSIAEAKTAYATTGLPKKLARHHTDPDASFYGWNDIWLDPRFRDWNIETYADRVRCPVLLIQGEADEYGTTAQLDAIAARVPRSETVLVPGAGHSPHRDAPGTVLDRVASFVARA